MKGIEILLTLQATVKDLKARLERAEAETVKVQGKLDSITGRVLSLESAQPKLKPTPIDAAENVVPSEADREAIRERLRRRTLDGLAANKVDRSRAGRCLTHKDAGK